MTNLTRLERLRARRIDPNIKVAGLNEAYGRLLTEDSAVQYAIGAMQPIDPEYTRRTIEERSRVESQLQQGFSSAGLAVSFDYQGSVTNDTHIRAHSDVDLLTVDEKWVSIELPNVPSSPYSGNTVEDLRAIRKQSITVLKGAYPAAKIDDSGSKAVNISGGSLKRKIDVVACGHWHTVEYMRNPEKHWLGIQVLDNLNGVRISNKPFLHNKRITDRDALMNGGVRKLVRLLKSLKYDSDDAIDLSSYDIAGIVYNMPDDKLLSRPGQDLVLVDNCHTFLLLLNGDKALREQIEVPNGTRKVFCAEGATEKGLNQMIIAVTALRTEIEKGLSRSFKKLAEARVIY
ncbi:MAG: hypothetical protein ACXU8A_09055 [Burkholderiaceae bacterium]